MSDKFSYYDVIANIVPGLITLGLMIWLFGFFDITFAFNTSEILGVGLGLAVAYAIGHVLQALSSFLQPIYFYLWGGRPSDNLLSGRNSMLGGGRDQIVAQLKESFRINNKTDDEEYSEIFTRAMSLVSAEKIGRVEAFNASYAFHRALLTTAWILASVLTVIVITSALNLVSLPESNEPLLIITVLGWCAAIVEFFRARQRGYYYAKEVIYLSYHYLTIMGGCNGKSSSH